MGFHRLRRDELDAVPEYAVPEELVKILKNILNGNNMMANSANKWTTFLEKIKNLKDFDDDNYFSTLRNLLYLEECFDNNSIDDVKKKEIVKICYKKEESHFKINLKKIDKELCFLTENSVIEVQNIKMFPKRKSKNDKIEPIKVDVEKHSFIVTKVSSESGYINVKPKNYEKFRRQHQKNDTYYIEFEYSNWPTRVCQYAIDLIDCDLGSLKLYTRRLSYTPKTLITSFINKNIARNPEQVQAVQQIVGGTSYPSPYLVFGPPGTGKTSTIVEAVCQLIERGKNILICTPSNVAADEVTRRLLNCDISPDLIYRMTSKSVERGLFRDTIPQDVKICMHFEKGGIEYLKSSAIRRKKVIISTLISAARFLRLTYFENFFNYIFIDEAGQATQPETFIPFAISRRHRRCNLVMSGDPKQLGPIVMTKYGSHLLGISMLERLMEKSYLYKKDYNSNKYNPNFLTKLVQNYRNHETILRLPNHMYYDSELIACAGNGVKIAENWRNLPIKGFPIIFHPAYGHEENNESHSIANTVEAEIVMNYVEKLLYEGLEGMQIFQRNIGIITPFRYQKSIIMKKLKNRNLSKISVGTVESFQGQERDIIIVSLVRSAIFKNGKKPHIGFLNDDKRFNVTITRAKCLLIVIGNPMVLQIADCWRNFINYCNGTYCIDKVITKNPIQSYNNQIIENRFMTYCNRTYCTDKVITKNPIQSYNNQIIENRFMTTRSNQHQSIVNRLMTTRIHQNQDKIANNHQNMENKIRWTRNDQNQHKIANNHQNMENKIRLTRNDQNQNVGKRTTRTRNYQNQAKNENNQNVENRLMRTKNDQNRNKSANNQNIPNRLMSTRNDQNQAKSKNNQNIPNRLMSTRINDQNRDKSANNQNMENRIRKARNEQNKEKTDNNKNRNYK
ncbi:putative helicase mov-10-B.1 [Leptopilina heterotoma]|uniref:putative helicase mov-10-B.1 n=1 Tax=Leptopilina heterotoma TaxID=63436 RepID=UPI001CA943AF|nr:putative helicase mov-10-B.1 [Leptopilina heterotoma]XP_043473648.1 putative helicase mov-10-B.1 [Leptopilina heterotoma]